MSDDAYGGYRGMWRDAEAELEATRTRLREVEDKLRKAEPVLVAADRVREAYDAMVEGRDLGRLADWSHEPIEGKM